MDGFSQLIRSIQNSVGIGMSSKPISCNLKQHRREFVSSQPAPAISKQTVSQIGQIYQLVTY